MLTFAQAQKLAGRAKPTPATPTTVNDALNAYFRFLRSDGRSPHSVNDAERRAQALIRPALGSVSWPP